MDRGPVLTLDDNERRKIAARMRAGTSAGQKPQEGPCDGPKRQRQRRRDGRKAAPERGAARLLGSHGACQARRFERLLLDLPERLGFPAAFCAAAVTWSVAVALVLGCFEVLGG